MNPTLLITVLVLLLPAFAYSQATPLTPEQAVETALRQNPAVHAAAYDVEVALQLKRASGDIGKTLVLGTFGQYNSAAREDNNITISQSIPFPTTLAARGALGTALVRHSELARSAAENDVAYQVKAAWYELAYVTQLYKLMQQQDSTFAAFARAASAHHRVGEGTLLEKVTAEARAQQSHTQLLQHEKDIAIYQARLQALLYTTEPVVLAADALQPRAFQPADTAGTESSPALQLQQQTMNVSARELRVERNHLLPDITLGYFNQTLIGVPVENNAPTLATRSDRFQGFQVGLSVPLWFRPQAGRIAAAEKTQLAAEKRYQQLKRSTETELAALTQEVNKYAATLAYYRESALPQADLILKQSTKAYQGGDVGYVEYLQGVTTATALRTGYLETLNQYNHAVLRVEYLLGQR